MLTRTVNKRRALEIIPRANNESYGMIVLTKHMAELLFNKIPPNPPKRAFFNHLTYLEWRL